MQHSEAKDSMAFNTIQPVNMDASLNEDFMLEADEKMEMENSVCQRENTMTVTQKTIPEMQDIELSKAICVTDESNVMLKPR